MIRRATGKIEAYTKESGEVVNNARYAENEEDLTTPVPEEEILDELLTKEVSEEDQKE